MGRRVLRLFQIALGSLVITFAVVPGLHAQRGGSSRHAGFTSRPSASFSPAQRSFAPRSRSSMQPGHGTSAQIQQRHRPVGRAGVGYRVRYPYLNAGYPGLLSYGFPFGYGDDFDDATAPQPPEPGNDAGNDTYPQVAGNTPPPLFRPAYGGPVEAAPVHAQPATTLVFNDGRPSVEVHNYALTGSTLYALDGDTRKEIPLSQLDVPATIEANRRTGVDFALPSNH